MVGTIHACCITAPIHSYSFRPPAALGYTSVRPALGCWLFWHMLETLQRPAKVLYSGPFQRCDGSGLKRDRIGCDSWVFAKVIKDYNLFLTCKGWGCCKDRRKRWTCGYPCNVLNLLFQKCWFRAISRFGTRVSSKGIRPQKAWKHTKAARVPKGYPLLHLVRMWGHKIL